MNLKPAHRLAVCLLPCLMLWWGGEAHAAQAEDSKAGDFLYRTQPRDTLIGVGRRLLLDPTRWREVQERNHIANPRAIPPGSILRIPYTWLRLTAETATVSNLAGTVTLKGKAIAAGEVLQQGSVVETGANGSVTIDLADGSVITLQKSSTLDLNEMAQVNGVTSAHSIRLKLDSGRVEAKVKPHRDVGRFEILTPVAVSAVRGTEFRDSFDGSDRHSTAETLEGTLSVGGNAGADSVAVAQGFGTRVEKDRPPLAPVALLPPPDLSTLSAVFSTPVMSIHLPPVAGAQHYRIQLSPDPQFHALSADVLTSDGRADIPDIPDGDYWLRARAIDGLGIEGTDAVHKITQHVLPPAPAPSSPVAGAKFSDPHVRIAWSMAGPNYALQVAPDATFAAPVMDRERLAQPEADIENLPPGNYVWRVASVNAAGERGPWSEPRSFSVLPTLPMPETPHLEKSRVSFTWEASAGRTYRAQVARDATFEHLVEDQRTDKAQWSVPKLMPGVYFVRVQAIEADGSTGPFSAARQFTVPVPLWVKIVVPVAAGLAFLL